MKYIQNKNTGELEMDYILFGVAIFIVLVACTYNPDLPIEEEFKDPLEDYRSGNKEVR